MAERSSPRSRRIMPRPTRVVTRIVMSSPSSAMPPVTATLTHAERLVW